MKKGKKRKTRIKSVWFDVKDGKKKVCRWRWEIEFYDKNIKVYPKLEVELKPN